MKKKTTTLSLFYKKKFEDFLAHMLEAKKLEEEPIHQMKKEIRYFNHLLFLYESMNIENKDLKKITKRIRPLEKLLRDYRKIQICDLVFEENKPKGAAAIKRVLNQDRAPLGKQLTEEIDNFDVKDYKKRSKAVFTHLKSINEADFPNHLYHIMQDEIDIVYKLLASSRDGMYFKEMRRYLIIAKCMTKLYLLLDENTEMTYRNTVLNELCTILGKWKDKYCLVKKMEHIKEHTSSINVKSIARSILNTQINEMSELEDHFYKLMHKGALNKDLSINFSE